MDLSALGSSLQSTLGAHLPAIFGALAILVVGWLLAVAARASVLRVLSFLKVNERIADTTHQRMNVESGIAIGVFWLILLITVVGVFNTLDLALVSDPFQTLLNQVFAYLPRLIAGTLLLVIAWVLATLIRAIASKALAATSLDDKLSEHAAMEPMSKSVADVLFWLVILLFIPAVLGAYELAGLLAPVQTMLDKFLGVLPNVFAALVIGFVGWLVARVLRGLVGNLLAAAGADRLGPALGFGDQVRISRVVGMVVFILVFVPTLIAALEALQIEAISRPATDMLGMILQAVPNILAAAVILVITYYAARFGAMLVARLLNGIGFDGLPQKLGLAHAFSDSLRASDLVAKLIVFFAMLFATVEAANRLEFQQVRDVVTLFIEFGGDVLLGGVILVIGFWLANIAANAINQASGAGTPGLARIARVAILGLVLAMGLRAMGIADDIVNLAFGLTLGAVAVAVALAFGLGGREAAGKQMDYWLSKLRKED
jgi:hypothetical protein